MVGQALLAQLSRSKIICLVRQIPVTGPNVITISCDISLPKFGLSPAQWRDIAERIDCIVHSAAVTDFSESDELIMRTNVQGIENILELARVAQVPLYHISTAFVHLRKQANGTQEDSAYVNSKREGERLVRESGLPSVIIRPSIVIGDSTSGSIARFQGIHSVAGAIIKGFLPMMPASPQAYLDFIPQDVLAQAVVALIDEGNVGQQYWITAGDQSLTVRQTVDAIVEFTRQLGRPIKPPRFATPDIIDRLIRPVFMSALPPTVQKGFDRLIQISSYLNVDEPFPTSLPEIQARNNLPPLPDLKEALMRSLEYWAEVTGYAKRAAYAT